MSYVRAVRGSLRQLPSDIDRHDARAILEFATLSSYPTAPDPLLAVAHAAAQIILTLHDEVHEMLAIRRRAGVLEQCVSDIADEVQLVITNWPTTGNDALGRFAQSIQQMIGYRLAALEVEATPAKLDEVLNEPVRQEKRQSRRRQTRKRELR